MITEEDKEKLEEYKKWLKLQAERNGMIGTKIHLKNKHNRKKSKKIWLSQD